MTVTAARERSTADFVQIKDSHGLTLWINLDYVTRIGPGLDPCEQDDGAPRRRAVAKAPSRAL